MKLIVMHQFGHPKAGHATTEVAVEDIIAETERQMNEVGGRERCSVLVTEPGQPAVRVDDLTTLPAKHPASEVVILPQLVGG